MANHTADRSGYFAVGCLVESILGSRWRREEYGRASACENKRPSPEVFCRPVHDDFLLKFVAVVVVASRSIDDRWGRPGFVLSRRPTPWQAPRRRLGLSGLRSRPA